VQTSFDIFLSHAHDDAAWVEELARHLEDNYGFRVWLDKWVLVPGRSWQQAMARGLEDARNCAVFISAVTPKGWFDKEIQRALDLQTRNPKFGVIPVLMPNGDPSAIPPFLASNTWADFRDGQDRDYALHVLRQGVRGEPVGRWPKADKPKEVPDLPPGRPATECHGPLEHQSQLSPSLLHSIFYPQVSAKPADLADGSESAEFSSKHPAEPRNDFAGSDYIGAQFAEPHKGVVTPLYAHPNYRQNQSASHESAQIPPAVETSRGARSPTPDSATGPLPLQVGTQWVSYGSLSWLILRTIVALVFLLDGWLATRVLHDQKLAETLLVDLRKAESLDSRETMEAKSGREGEYLTIPGPGEDGPLGSSKVSSVGWLPFRSAIPAYRLEAEAKQVGTVFPMKANLVNFSKRVDGTASYMSADIAPLKGSDRAASCLLFRESYGFCLSPRGYSLGRDLTHWTPMRRWTPTKALHSLPNVTNRLAVAINNENRLMLFINDHMVDQIDKGVWEDLGYSSRSLEPTGVGILFENTGSAAFEFRGFALW